MFYTCRALRYPFPTSKIATNLTWLFSKQKIFLVIGRFRLFTRLTVTAYHMRFPLKFSWHRGSIFQRRVRIPEKSASGIPRAIAFLSSMLQKSGVSQKSNSLIVCTSVHLLCCFRTIPGFFFHRGKVLFMRISSLDRIRWIIKIQIEKSSVSVGKECSFPIAFV